MILMEFGLLGKKLSHSFSSTYFNTKFRENNIPASYQNFELEHLDALPELIAEHPHLRGLNVTIPFKTEIIPFLHTLDPVSEQVGAVNTVSIWNGRLHGFNTDVSGFRDALAEFYPDKPGGRALILGSGGAAKAVRYALEHYYFFDEIQNASRSKPGGNHISYFDLQEEGLGKWDLIINATPLGMFPDSNSIPDLPYATLKAGTCLFDLVYNPETTLFMKEGLKRGCKVSNGMEMLIMQAEAAWEIWNK